MIRLLLLSLAFLGTNLHAEEPRPHIVLVMADDMGWGQTGYRGHPVLKTPNLDAMAEAGLRLDRFYAGASVCSPTRASVLTGRTNDRTGVQSHGYGIRLQEKTAPRALAEAGYATGHFGKWHLNGVRGPGVPLFADDPNSPGGLGFEEWITVSNFFDLDPLMSRKGEWQEYEGDSSEIIVDQALEFIGRMVKAERPSYSVVWYGSPHDPFWGLEKDRALFPDDGSVSVDHHAELVAMDRSIGTLRRGLRDLGIAENTLLWFCSDNGGLPKVKPDSTGGLRGNKGTFYEGGLRVPCIIEWPAGIPEPRVSEFPSVTMDIFPTIADILGLPDEVLLQPSDGMSLKPLFEGEIGRREKPIPFRQMTRGGLLDNTIKVVAQKGKSKEGEGEWRMEVFDLAADPTETMDISESQPEVAARAKKAFLKASASIDESVAGRDYPEGKVDPVPRSGVFWTDMEEYKPFFEEWRKRPEYQSRIERALKKKR